MMTTLSNWVSDDESLGILITSYENVVNTIVMQNIVDAIKAESEMEGNRKDMSQWWADRKMKYDGFSTKTETDLTTQGDKIQSGVIILPQKNGNQMETPIETGDSTS